MELIDLLRAAMARLSVLRLVLFRQVAAISWIFLAIDRVKARWCASLATSALLSRFDFFLLSAGRGIVSLTERLTLFLSQ